MPLGRGKSVWWRSEQLNLESKEFVNCSGGGTVLKPQLVSSNRPKSESGFLGLPACPLAEQLTDCWKKLSDNPCRCYKHF